MSILRQVQAKAATKLKLLTMIQATDLPAQAKAGLALLITKTNDEDIKAFIKGFHDFLNDAENIQTSIKAKFPELFT